MIYNYPFYGGSRRYYRYPNYSYGYPKKQNVKQEKTTTSLKPISQKNEKTCSVESEEKAIFELFGIKLYFDDILLVCLIFFLYNEGVKDQYLFIVLILLLLS